jgi:exosome complex component RRP4
VIHIIASLQEIDTSTRNAIARVSNIIRILASHCIALTDTILLEAYDWAIEQESDVNDLLQDDFGSALVVAVGGQG